MYDDVMTVSNGAVNNAPAKRQRTDIKEDGKRFKYAKEIKRSIFYTWTWDKQRVMLPDPDNRNGAFWPCKGFISLDKYVSNGTDNGVRAYAVAKNEKNRQEILSCFRVDNQIAILLKTSNTIVLEAGDYLLFNKKKQFMIMDAERFNRRYLLCNGREKDAFAASINSGKTTNRENIR